MVTMKFAAFFGINLLFTLLECGLFGPAASKLDGLGLRGWAARAPFYLLPLYLSPLIISWHEFRGSYFRTGLLGLMLSVPSSLWVIAARCPFREAAAHAVFGLLQGLLLARLARSLLAHGQSASGVAA